MKITGTILTLALGIACLQSAHAQTFKKIRVAGNVPLTQVASGGKSVWALGNNQPYIFNGGSFVLANSITLSQIAVGGGNADQGDEVWAVNSPPGTIYRARKSGSTWTFSQIPGALDLIAVGPGYQPCHPYEVWGLNTGSQIYRYNYCTSQFDQEPGFLCDIHVGGGDIWGADCGPDVFRFNFSTLSFDQITPTPSPFAAFPQLTVGSNGDVWATDTSNSVVYKYDDFVGFHSYGCCVTQIEAGNGTWILDGANIYRWEPSAQHFGQVPGALVSISVGSGGGVWGINSSHQVFAFTTP